MSLDIFSALSSNDKKEDQTLRLDLIRLIPKIFMSEKILKNGLPVLIWIIIWGFPICLGTLKPMAFSTKIWPAMAFRWFPVGGVPGCIPFRLFIERHIGGRTYHVRIGVKRLKNMLGNTNSWSCAWYHFVGHIGLRCLEWLFVCSCIGGNIIN